MEVTFAVRHIGEVVIDVLSGARDPDGDIVVEQKAGAGDQGAPLALIVGVPYECGAAGLCDTEVGMGRSYRAIEPAQRSMLQVVVERRPEGGNTPSNTKGMASIVNPEYCRADLVVAVRNTYALLRLWLLKGDADAARGVRHHGG
jgi:hypothetical protein